MIGKFKLDNVIKGILLTSCLLQLNYVNAEVIEKKLGNGQIITAEFNKGDPSLPVIFLLHGFLQTREAQTVARVYNSLVDNDYTVLAPTLSLGISHRRQSLACEAVHSHTIQSDAAEIELWSHWLHKKTNQKIVLIGHSSGGVVVLSYLNDYPYGHVDQGIFISLGHFGSASGSNEEKSDEKRAAESIKQGKYSLEKYSLSYCKEYVTPPENYLSYSQWQTEKILTTMKKLNIPITVIIGSNDKRISKKWIQSMKKNGIKTLVVEGAGHFFDGEYEFDLQDIIEETLLKNRSK